jgi:AbrB family looped-hinge helix DNA binding protein
MDVHTLWQSVVGWTITTYELIREAIFTRQQVLGDYHGRARVFCPHVLGWCRGARRCLGYQFGGSSRSGRILPGSPNNWRCFNIDDLRNVRLRPGRWYGGPSHERPQRCMDVVDVDVEKPETLADQRGHGRRGEALVPTATLTSKGQVTIPKVIREALKVNTGDRLDFVVESEGRVVVRAGTPGSKSSQAAPGASRH